MAPGSRESNLKSPSSPASDAALPQGLNRPKLRVLLVGNYATDRQESMQRFGRMLAVELPRRGVAAELCAPQPFFGRLKPSATGLGKWLGYLDKFIVFPFSLRAKIRELMAASRETHESLVVHICDHSNAHYTRYLQKVPHLVTCHDLLAVRMARGEFGPGKVSYTGKKLQHMIVGGLQRAAKLVCVSHATRADVERLLGRVARPVEVVHNGFNYQYSPLAAIAARARVAELLADARQPQRPDFRYLLHVGGGHWYKNRLGVLKIYAAWRERWNSAHGPAPSLLMIGAPFSPEMQAFLANHPEWAGDVISMSFVDDGEDLRALYSAAELFLFPSLEEGFGWPIVEAQACGCRVVTTGKAPMTEIGGEAAVYADPAGVDGTAADGFTGAARLVAEILAEDAAARQSRIAAGLANATRFSTEEMICHYIDVYHGTLAEAPSAWAIADRPSTAPIASDVAR